MTVHRTAMEPAVGRREHRSLRRGSRSEGSGRNRARRLSNGGSTPAMLEPGEAVVPLQWSPPSTAGAAHDGLGLAGARHAAIGARR